MFPIGAQRVGVERSTPVLDDDDNPTYDELGHPVVEDTTVWVDNSCFEIQSPSEQQNLTVTTTGEIAWAFLPIADGTVPAVDDDSEPAPIEFFDTEGKPSISSGAVLWHNGLRYEMRGDAVLEQDIHGREHHVFCICERTGG